MYEMKVPTMKDLYDTMCDTCVSPLARQNTVLMFLPGKAEISEVKQKLMKAGVKESNIFILQ